MKQETKLISVVCQGSGRVAGYTRYMGVAGANSLAGKSYANSYGLFLPLGSLAGEGQMPKMEREKEL